MNDKLPNSFIDLSILKADDNRNLYSSNKCDARESIRQYRARVKERMADKDKCSTPWGEWEEVKHGLYRLSSTLDNRLIDTELCMPFVSSDEAFHENGSIQNSKSSLGRSCHRDMSIAFLKDMMLPSGGKDPYTSPLLTLKIPAYSSSYEGESIRKEYEGCIEYPLYQALIRAWKHPFPVLRELQRLIDEAAAKLRNDQIKTGTMTISIKDLISDESPLIVDNAPSQNYFINLETIARLCSDDADVVNNSKAWVFFALQTCLTGLPANGLTPHGDLDPNHERPLSPSGHKFDPIYAIISGLWSLGFCDEYEIHLSLDHPNPAMRGLYIAATVGQKTQYYFDKHGDETLSDPPKSPYYVNALKAALEQVSAVSIFDQVLKQSMEDTRI